MAIGMLLSFYIYIARQTKLCAGADRVSPIALAVAQALAQALCLYFYVVRESTGETVNHSQFF